MCETRVEKDERKLLTELEVEQCVPPVLVEHVIDDRGGLYLPWTGISKVSDNDSH